MDNEHRKLFVIKQSKWCKFVPKMHKKYVWLTGGAYSAPIDPRCNMASGLATDQACSCSFGTHAGHVLHTAMSVRPFCLLVSATGLDHCPKTKTA